MTDKQRLINQAVRLTILGQEVEHRRSIVKRMVEISMEPTLELFRAIDDFNLALMEFETRESEHLALRTKITTKQK